MSANMPEFKSDPAVVALIPAVNRIRSFAAGLVIKSARAYEEAATLLKSIKGQLASFEEARTKITKPINDGLREVNAQHRATVAPLLADEIVIKNAMIRYSDEQDRIREEEQRRQNEIARKEQERLQAIADRAQAKGQEDKAEQFQQRAAQVVAPIAQQAAPKVGGIAVPLVWTFDIIDASLIPREYLDVNETRIRKVVQAMQGNTKIPGIRVRQVKRIAAGSA